MLRPFIFFLVLLLPVQGWAAMAFDAQSSSFAFGDTSCEVDHITGSLTDGAMFIAVSVGGDGTTINTPTVGGSSTGVSLLATQTIGDIGRISVFYKLAPASGSATISAGLGSAQNCGILVQTFQGVAQTSTFGTPASDFDFSIATDPTLDVSSSGGLTVLDWLWFVGNEGRSAVADAGQTEHGQNNIAYGIAGSAKTASGATTTMSWALTAPDLTTPNLGEWAIVGVAVNAAAGGGGSSPSACGRLLLLGVGKC